MQLVAPLPTIKTIFLFENKLLSSAREWGLEMKKMCLKQINFRSMIFMMRTWVQHYVENVQINLWICAPQSTSSFSLSPISF